MFWSGRAWELGVLYIDGTLQTSQPPALGQTLQVRQDFKTLLLGSSYLLPIYLPYMKLFQCHREKTGWGWGWGGAGAKNEGCMVINSFSLPFFFPLQDGQTHQV